MTNTDILVEDEPAGLLLEALTSVMEGSEESDGVVTFEGLLVGDAGAALVHALGRVTAELHADDMRSFLPGRIPNRRTADQRSADAFFVLVDRLEEALSSSTDSTPQPTPRRTPARERPAAGRL